MLSSSLFYREGLQGFNALTVITEESPTAAKIFSSLFKRHRLTGNHACALANKLRPTMLLVTSGWHCGVLLRGGYFSSASASWK